MLFNLEDWENMIHFGNLFASIGKKPYFLALGTIPKTGVGFIARKITVICPKTYDHYGRAMLLHQKTYLWGLSNTNPAVQLSINRYLPSLYGNTTLSFFLSF